MVGNARTRTRRSRIRAGALALGGEALPLALAAACSGSNKFDDDGDDSAQAEDDLSTSSRWQPPAGARPVVYDEAPAWKKDGSSCSTVPLPGTQALRAKINSTYKGVNASYPFNCRPQRNNPSVTSVHGIGRAIDIMIPRVGGAANRKVGDPIAKYLALNAKSLGVQYIIWDRTSWGDSYPNGHLYGAYKDIPHDDHIHVELNRAGAK
jgi:hypothetical protein